MINGHEVRSLPAAQKDNRGLGANWPKGTLGLRETYLLQILT